MLSVLCGGVGIGLMECEKISYAGIKGKVNIYIGVLSIRNAGGGYGWQPGEKNA